MSAESPAAKTAVNGIRTAFGVGGLIALIVGILILVWPGHTATVLTAIIAIYAIVGGLVYAGLGIFSKSMGGWARVGHIILGVIFIIAGVIALTNLTHTTAWLAVFIGILVGILWIVEGIVALTTLGASASKGWTVFFAILSIVAGIILLFSPLYIVALWWLLGIALVVLGIVQIVRAFTWKGDTSQV
ncbi:HdeD family acid-resistance protein [Humibacter soli]